MSEQTIVKTAGAPGIATRDGTTAPAPAAPQQAAPAPFKAAPNRKWLVLAALVVVGGVAGYFGWNLLRPAKLPEGFASSNGRIEATEIDVATKLAGRIIDELVDEGDFVTAGQVVAHMDVDVLTAQLHEAQASLRSAQSLLESSKSTVRQRQSEKASAEAIVTQREAELRVATSRLARARTLTQKGATTQEEFDTHEASFYSAKATLEAARANVAAAQAAITTAEAMVLTAEAQIAASQAKINRVQADIDDSTLKTPRAGRVQYRVAQPGEVLPAGGKVLNMVDLTDVYMTFFLPEATAGRIKVGTEVRLVLDAFPELVLPAKVTFVADVAQFTPKTVETAVERQKLTFRLKAHIPPDLLKKYIRDVKTGLPGVAYVQLDPQAEWPAHLQVRLPE